MLQQSDMSTVHRDNKRKLGRPIPYKRPQSLSPVTGRTKVIINAVESSCLQHEWAGSTGRVPSSHRRSVRTTLRLNLTTKPEGRSRSLSGTVIRKTLQDHNTLNKDVTPDSIRSMYQDEEKIITIPQCTLAKLTRVLAIKKREFIKMRKSLIAQQNAILESYSNLKELETRISANKEDSVGDLQVVTMSGWPAHDVLLLVRDDVDICRNMEINSLLGSHVLHQLSSRLNPIPDEVLAVCAEISARRLELLDVLKNKHRLDRSSYSTNLDWKSKNLAFDAETERLHKLVTETTDNLKTKIVAVFELAKIPWVDRDTLIKKVERVQKENMVLQSKLEELTKNSPDKSSVPPLPVTQDAKSLNAIRYTLIKKVERVQKENMVLQSKLEELTKNSPDKSSVPPLPVTQSTCEELAKERAACESLKEMVASAETLLRVARARIATLERQLKDTRAELEGARKRQKELEHLYRTRESSYDARSKKLIEVSKTGEITIETLSRQRDALEMRVKELREQAVIAEQAAKAREAKQQARIDAISAKAAEQEKCRKEADSRVVELEAKVKELEASLDNLQRRSLTLTDMDRKRCMEYLPSKENEPTDKETELWKELQATRQALSHVEEELHQSRLDKDSFLSSLARIAQGEGQNEGSENLQEKIAIELLDKEQQIVKLKRIIDEHEENQKSMEESMTQYENQLAALRLEVRRLRNYDCFNKEVKYEDLETELLELNMQVSTLNRERTELVTATASRALMLERYERSTELFANMIRMRRELRALLDGRTTPPVMDETYKSEVSRSISSVCVNAADTWTALRAERVRVMRLEAALLTQRLQLERQGQVRTLLERRRAMFERIASEKNQTNCTVE